MNDTNNQNAGAELAALRQKKTIVCTECGKVAEVYLNAQGCSKKCSNAISVRSYRARKKFR